jgi:aminomethyltransferase
MPDIKKTALYDVHKKLNANIVNFSGTYLPVFYSSIQEEHNAVRNAAGIFDVSHMGNILLKFNKKDESIKTLNYILANDFKNIIPGKCIYSTMLNHDGGIIDDVIVMGISDNVYHIIVNSANIQKDYEWIKSFEKQLSFSIENKSDYYSIIALQGKKSSAILEDAIGFNLNKLNSFELEIIQYKNEEIIISKTGYTGEDGCEIVINNNDSPGLFNDLLNSGLKYNLLPCGLGARDTLRLEAALPLYGNELDVEHSPLQTNVAWSVKLNKESDFIGKKAITSKPENKFSSKLVGIEVLGKAIPRHLMSIIDNAKNKIGHITSGSYSPTLHKNIGLAYINPEFTENNELAIEIRNRTENVKIVKLPFYKRQK